MNQTPLLVNKTTLRVGIKHIKHFPYIVIKKNGEPTHGLTIQNAKQIRNL
jgi:hypothetical protein